MAKRQQGETGASHSPAGPGWVVVQWSGAVLTACTLVEVGLAFGIPGPERLPVTMFQAGLTVLLGLITWGAFRRSRAAAWGGALLALYYLITTVAVHLQSSVRIEGAELVVVPLERVLIPLEILASAGFLFGLLLLRLKAHRRHKS